MNSKNKGATPAVQEWMKNNPVNHHVREIIAIFEGKFSTQAVYSALHSLKKRKELVSSGFGYYKWAGKKIEDKPVSVQPERKQEPQQERDRSVGKEVFDFFQNDPGTVFTRPQVIAAFPPSKRYSVVRALSRMGKHGMLTRLDRGIYKATPGATYAVRVNKKKLERMRVAPQVPQTPQVEKPTVSIKDALVWLRQALGKLNPDTPAALLVKLAVYTLEGKM